MYIIRLSSNNLTIIVSIFLIGTIVRGDLSQCGHIVYTSCTQLYTYSSVGIKMTFCWDSEDVVIYPDVGFRRSLLNEALMSI